MRVLFVSSDNNKTSGAFLSMAQLCKELKDEFDVETLVVLPEHGDGVDILREMGITSCFIRSFHWVEKIERIKRNPLRYIKWILKFLYNTLPEYRISRLINRYNPDIVHINSTYSYVAAKPAIKAHIPLVWQLREYLEEGQGLQIIFKQYGYRLISRADSIICVSDGLKKKYEELLDNKKLVCVYNGINKEIFAKPNRRVFCEETIHLLSIGGLYPEKGQMTLIKACKLLNDNGITRYNLKIVGRGEERDNLLKGIEEYGLADTITLCGYTTEPAKYYSEADVVIVTSKEEAFGRVLIEGMMGGCLVISSVFKAAKEIIGQGDNGLLYEYNNHEQLYKQIRYAINHTIEMRKIADHARRFAIDSFSSTNNTKKILDIYRQVAANDN